MIYLLGRYAKLRIGGGNCLARKPICLYAISFITLFVGIVGIYYISIFTGHKSLSKLIFPLLGYANPLVIVMSVSLFYVVKNLPDLENAILNKILSANLFIYLITEVGGFVSYQKIANEFDSNPYIGFCHSIFIIVSCLLAGHVILKISKLILRNV